MVVGSLCPMRRSSGWGRLGVHRSTSGVEQVRGESQLKRYGSRGWIPGAIDARVQSVEEPHCLRVWRTVFLTRASLAGQVISSKFSGLCSGLTDP
jgi:hypothetical protein